MSSQYHLTAHFQNPHFCQVIWDQPCWNNCPDELKAGIISSIWISRKPSTVTKYCFSLRKFLNYCNEVSVPVILPMSSLFIAQYLEHVKQIKKSAVNDALTSIKWLQYFIPGINSFNNPLNDDLLSRLVESANRNDPKQRARKKPFTYDIIHAIIKNLPACSEIRLFLYWLSPFFSDTTNCLI